MSAHTPLLRTQFGSIYTHCIVLYQGVAFFGAKKKKKKRKNRKKAFTCLGKKRAGTKVGPRDGSFSVSGSRIVIPVYQSKKKAWPHDSNSISI